MENLNRKLAELSEEELKEVCGGIDPTSEKGPHLLSPKG